jgi:hypothetical protein
VSQPYGGSNQVHVNLTDSATLANLCLGKQQNIEGQLAQLRDVTGPAPTTEAMLTSILEAQSVLLMAVASLHIQRARQQSPAGLALPRIVGGRG